MNGKQKPDIYFIKAVHDKLEVDANVLLKTVCTINRETNNNQDTISLIPMAPLFASLMY